MGITVTFGSQPIEILIRGLEIAAQTTESDIVYVLNKQKTRILTRTARGVDVNEAQFAPYSTRGPYYYYPGKASKSRSAAAGRKHKQIGGTRTRLGVKFDSYAAFKSTLGRSVVDLTGPSAPHMLQAIVVRSDGPGAGTIGIYGSEADRAEGHNIGAGHLPKREFFGISASDEAIIGADIEELVGARIAKALT